jgi:hypothetical protein
VQALLVFKLLRSYIMLGESFYYLLDLMIGLLVIIEVVILSGG